MKKDNKYSIWIWILTFLIVGFLLYWLLQYLNKSPDDITGLLGLYTALYSLVLMLVQFKTIRKVSEETKVKLNQTVALSDLSKYSELIRGLGADVRNNNYEIALYKTQSIKEIVHKIEIADLSGSTNSDYNNIYSILATHINSYNDRLMSGEAEINKLVILNELETLTSFFQSKANEMMNIIN